MEARLPTIGELTTRGDSLMWIVGPGNMASENYSLGMQPRQVQGNYVRCPGPRGRNTAPSLHATALRCGGPQRGDHPEPGIPGHALR